jgi:predicted Zn-dependent protease
LLTQDESGLAVVMGHEIAHAVAEHGNERMSQILLTQLGGMALSEALGSQPQQTRDLWLGVYGLGAQVGVLLPYSRTHESEADRLGMVFMALAGYDPNVAIGFWERMAAHNQGQAPPEFLSTHPSDKTRIEDIKKYLPEAMRYYNK